jgi:regulator of sigma E protease
MKRVGITPDPAAFMSERYAVLPALVKAWELEAFYTVQTHRALFYLITGQISPKNLMGPLGIIQISGQAAKAGITILLQLLAILSVSLAVINFLPIPGLDGGHLVFLLIELVTRRRINPIWQERITTGGIYLLMALMVFVLYNDVVNLSIIDKLKDLFHLK